MTKSTKSKLPKPDNQTKKYQSQKHREPRPGLVNPWRKVGFVPWARRQFPTLRHEFQHFADRVWNFAEDELFSGDMKPPVDISETDQSVLIAMDLPGFDPKDIDIQINENTITIRSQREAGCCIEDNQQVFHRTERPCGVFSRTLTLPCDIAGNETATFSNGVLKITIPKSKSESARKIQVIG